jgi:hypothetical protein
MPTIPPRISSLLWPLFLGPDPRVAALKAVWAIAFLAGMLLSPKLWLSSRSYPLCPIIDKLPAVPAPFDYVWFIVLLVLLAAILIVPRPGRLLLAFVCLAGLLSLLDQSRWQPWFYQYLFVGMALATYPWHDPEAQPERRAAALNACRVIVAATYFWSGLQKCNPKFREVVFPWLVEPLVTHLSQGLRSVVLDGAWAVPLAETALGLGLLIPRLRLAAVLGVAVMHALILSSLGPWAHDFNSVVWPWNIAMPIMTALLFVRVEPLAIQEVIWPRRALHWVVLVLFGIMPALNFVDLWDDYLSASLYSGSTPEGHIYVRPSVRARVPEPVRSYFRPVEDWSSYHLNLYDWSMDEMNVPPYPARRVFRALARQFLEYADQPSEVVLDYYRRPNPFTGECPMTKYVGDVQLPDPPGR